MRDASSKMQPIRNRLILAASRSGAGRHRLAAQDAATPEAAPAAEAPRRRGARRRPPPRPRRPPPAPRRPPTAGRRARDGPAAARRAAAAQPEVMEIVKDTFGDWQVRCAPDGKECFMYQLGARRAEEPGRRGQHPEAAGAGRGRRRRHRRHPARDAAAPTASWCRSTPASSASIPSPGAARSAASRASG